MAVSLPTAADVRKAREQAAKTAAERAEVARTPLLAVLGAGDVRRHRRDQGRHRRPGPRRRARRGRVQHRAAELPSTRIAELPHAAERRRAAQDLDELRDAGRDSVYAEFAERGEKTWGQLRKQPQVQQAIADARGVHREARRARRHAGRRRPTTPPRRRWPR